MNDRENQPLLTLPRTCLFRNRASSLQVMTMRKGVAEARQVGMGIMNGDQVQVTMGVSGDDRVVLHPRKKITAGVHVRTTED